PAVFKKLQQVTIVLEWIFKFPIPEERLHASSREIEGKGEILPANTSVNSIVEIRQCSFSITYRALVHSVNYPIPIDIFKDQVAGKLCTVSLSVVINRIVINLFLRLKLSDNLVTPVDACPAVFD